MTDATIVKTVRHLARSIQGISYALIGELQAEGDISASLLHAKAELERLADDCETAAQDALLIERGKVATS